MAVLDLDEPANQTRFSRLVGSSQQAISKMVEKGVLRRGGTIGEWLLQYSERLREIAGGRGGDNQADLTTAKTEEARVKAALGRLQYHEKLGAVVHKEEGRAFLSNWAAYANREYRQGVERLVADMESQFGVSVPVDLREKHVGAAIERVRGYALKLGGDSGSGGGAVSGAEADAYD